jgi:hypothetical protein
MRAEPVSAPQPAHHPTTDRILTQVGVATTPGQPPPWDGEPLPLSAARLRPAFPVTALPGWVADMVAAVAEATQTPADLAGCVALACLATAAGGRVIVNVEHDWIEPLNLYVAVALPPASRKSAVFKTMTTPLYTAEETLQRNTAEDRARAEITANAARAKAAEAARIAEATYGTEQGEQALEDASAAAVLAGQLEVAPPPRLIADDTTPEAVASLLAQQGGRIAVLSAEGGIFDILAGRYSGKPNLDVFLKGHAGDKVRIDRKGRDPEFIDHPALTLAVAVQPAVFAELGTQDGFRNKGLLGRILYSLPTNTVGHRKIDPDPVPEPVKHAYAANLESLVLSLADWTDPAKLQLTPAAIEVVKHHYAAIEPRLDPETGDLAPIGDWAGKWIGAMARIAGLLHLAGHMRDGYTKPIDVDTIEAAAHIAHYYLNHALAVFDLMGADPLINDARHVLTWITRAQSAGFTRRDAFASLRGNRFRKVTDLDPVLELLTAHSYLRQRPDTQPRANGGRPPSPTYEVHPTVLSERNRPTQ